MNYTDFLNTENISTSEWIWYRLRIHKCEIKPLGTRRVTRLHRPASNVIIVLSIRGTMELNVPDTKSCQDHVSRLIEFSKLGLHFPGFLRATKFLLGQPQTHVIAHGSRGQGTCARERGKQPLTAASAHAESSNLSPLLRKTLWSL